MNLTSMLPILEGWIYKPVDIDIPRLVPAGQTITIQEERGRGWLASATIVLNRPDAVLIIKYEHGYGVYTIDAEPLEFYEAGLLTPNPIGFFCSRYDTVANVYALNYFPALPAPFNRRCTLSLRAVEPTTMINYISAAVKIYDYELFMKSLHEALGVKVE